MDPASLANLVIYSISIVLLIAGLVLVILPFYRAPAAGQSKWMWGLGALLSVGGAAMALVLLVRPVILAPPYLPVPTYIPVVELPTPVGIFPTRPAVATSATAALTPVATNGRPAVSGTPVLTATELASTLPLSPQVTSRVQVWAIDEDGVRVNVNALGVYNLTYLGDAYSLWPNDQSGDYKGWTTLVKIYFNRPIEWGLTEAGLIGPINAPDDLGNGGYYFDKNDAIAATQGDSLTLRLNAGDYLTLVVFDQRGRFGDNRGKVDVGITYGGP